MKNIVLCAAALSLAAVTLTTGCVSSDSGEVFSRSETKTASRIVEGTVVEVREGKVEGTKSGVGAIAGGVLGGATGTTIGGGSGRTVATAVGAVAGAALGAIAEEKGTQKTALQITVKLDTGETIMVVQDKDVLFQVGERVRAVITGGATRIQKL